MQLEFYCLPNKLRLFGSSCLLLFNYLQSSNKRLTYSELARLGVEMPDLDRR